MAKARNSYALWAGSTKSKTYSTLATKKEGRVQIVKDRVYQVTNPQTDPQMKQRVIFATVTKAAERMIDLIGISQEQESKVEYARQAFITQNIAFLKSVAGKTAGNPAHVLAAFAPKGNQQLIPNSYIVSKGTLQLPVIFVPKTEGDAGSFGADAWATVGKLADIPFGTYTPADLWNLLYGLRPGDQISVPQIYNEGTAQVMYDGNYDGAGIVDKTVLADFVCPRVVLLETMPTTELTINGSTTAAAIQDAMASGVDTAKSWDTLVDRLLDKISIDDTADDVMTLIFNGTYDEMLGLNNDDVLLALGVVISRKVDGKWRYTTSQLVCVFDPSDVDAYGEYFGFTLGHAADTYRADAVTDADGNFLQRGGQSDILPPDFQ